MSVGPGRLDADIVPARRLPDLGVRAASGFVLIAVALGSTLLGGAPFAVAWLLAASAVLFEWQRLVGGSRLGARTVLGVAGLVAIGTLALWTEAGAVALLLVLVAIVAALAGTARRLWAGAGMLYAGLFVIALAALRFSHPDGLRALIWLFATVWATDVFAYLGGRLVGGPKLWPRVSPSKTWSGTLTGLAAGAVIGTFAALRDRFSPADLAPMLALTAVAAILSQVGDAAESAIKRRFGVKDTGRIIPGHGGLMDRLDGFVAAAVFAFLFGLARGLPSAAAGLFAWR